MALSPWKKAWFYGGDDGSVVAFPRNSGRTCYVMKVERYLLLLLAIAVFLIIGSLFYR
jgi:hypothetical protein